MASPPDPAPERRADAVSAALLIGLCLIAASRYNAAAVHPDTPAPTLTAYLSSPERSAVIETPGTQTACFLRDWDRSRVRPTPVDVRDTRHGAAQTVNLAEFTHVDLHFSSDEPTGRCRMTEPTYTGSGF